MFEALFAFLFKYRPAVFEKGDLAFGAPGSVMLLLAAAAIVGIPAVLTYTRVRGRSTSRDRLVLGAFRAAVLVLILACLFRPMLLLSAAVPQRNWVGVLVDDSRSMRIRDGAGGSARSDFVRHALGGPDSALLAGLSRRFRVRLYRFSSTAEHVSDAGVLQYASDETRIGDAIERAREDLQSVPLSGLVVVTDGADNSRAVLQDELLSLRARSVPVFTVGVGRERFDRDIELPRVTTPASVLAGSAIDARVFVRQRGYAGRRVPLVVEDDGAEIARQEVVLPSDGDVSPVSVHVTMSRPGARTLIFRVPAQPGEQVTENNAQRASVFVRGGRDRVLYVEGVPRYEVKFIREAIAGDSGLQLVVLQRTAENKYLRLDVDSPEELTTGFPKTRRQLFQYRAVILGSIEASAFTRDQLQMLADFVSVRGGALLFLGGRRAFAEGGYAGTPLADAMPVVVEGDAVPDSLTFFADLSVHETPAGASHPVTQIDSTEAASAKKWESLPSVSTVNRVGRVKPGAEVLLEGTVPRGGRSGLPNGKVPDYSQPVLVWQHYGRGIAAALPVQDTWNWRMGASVDANDRSFQTFWRQLLRWLGSDAPGRVVASVSDDRVAPGAAVRVRAEVSDSSFARVNDAKVVAKVTSPRGVTRDIPLDWNVQQDGEYAAGFVATDTGRYAVRVEAASRDGSRALDSTYVSVAPSTAEYFDAEMRAPLLQRIARETGGRFYTAANAASLPEDVALSQRGVTVVNEMDLWDMPAVLLLLIGLMAAEWWYRKGRGLA